jgi:hypothetical protein
MTLKMYLENMELFLQKRPQALNMEVVVQISSYGGQNKFELVELVPEIVQLEGEDDDLDFIQWDSDEGNYVCIN